MKIPTKTRYGMRAMVELASGYPDKPISLRQVAEKQSIPIKYLEQLISLLKVAGYVRSVRGIHGGYIFAKPPEETTLYEIFIALEGPTALVDCVSDSHLCNDCDNCPTRNVWIQMSDAVQRVLENQTIADLQKEAERIEQVREADHPGTDSASDLEVK